MGLVSQAQPSRGGLVLQRALMYYNQVSNVRYYRLTSSTAAAGPVINPTCLHSITFCCFWLSGHVPTSLSSVVSPPPLKP